MSVLLPIFFAGLGIFALIAMLATWRRHLPQFGELRRALREPLVETVRLTIAERVLLRIRGNCGPLRHNHRPRPVTHRLHGRLPRRTAV
jgi:hypothetical protein